MITTNQTEASYETLHTGAVVNIKVPKRISFKPQVEFGDRVLPEHLQWGIAHTGAVFNFHLYGGDMSLVNTAIRARVEVVEKITENGRKFVLVNLYRVDESECPTHKLVVLADQYEKQPHWLTFSTPNMRGFVALIGPDEKIVPPAATAHAPQAAPVRKDRRAPSVPSSAQPIVGNRPFADALASHAK